MCCVCYRYSCNQEADSRTLGVIKKLRLRHEKVLLLLQQYSSAREGLRGDYDFYFSTFEGFTTIGEGGDTTISSPGRSPRQPLPGIGPT